MIRPVAADGRIDLGGPFVPILRPRVIERIGSAAMQRIVLIVAPAGYGKSVALRHYLESLDTPHVRYDVREEHSTLLGFVRGLADALIAVAPDARKTLSGAYEESRSSGTPATDLAMWLHAHVKTFTGIIAIDDLHLAENDPDICRFLVSMIDRTKGRARWIIASRSSLDLPVGSWLAYGDMDLNVDEHDLRFTIDEARQTAKASRVGVRDEELAQILSLTEGWPTALSFALRTSTRSVDLRNIAAGTREMVYRYLAEQVYAMLDDRERELLHLVGFMPEIDVDVLRAAGYENAKALVEQLRDRVAFIYPDRPGVYRCHDLFRDFLQHQVELRGDDAAAAVQKRAAQALEQNGNLAAALGAFTQARAGADILRILENAGFDLLEQAHADAVQTAVDSLAQDVRATNPAVLALRGATAANGGRLDRAESLFERARARCERASLRARIIIALALVRVNQGREIVSLLDGLREEELPVDVLGEISALRAVACAYSGSESGARTAMQQAESYVREVESERVRAKILQRMGVAALTLRMPYPDVSNFFSRAAALACEQAMFGLASKAWGFLAAACELYEDDTVKSAWYAQHAVTAGLKSGERVGMQNALLQLIHIETWRGNAERVASLEQQFVATSTTDAERMGYIMPTKAALAAWQGRFDDAHRIMSMVTVSSHYAFDRLFDGALHALYFVAAGRRRQAIEVCENTLRQCEDADFGYLHGQRLGEMARIVCAIVFSLAGRGSTAARILHRRFEQSAPFVQALRDAALAISRAVKTPSLRPEVCEALEALAIVGYGGLARILEQVMQSINTRPTIEGRRVTLTKSEIDVLRALAEGRSPKEIAAQTGRSVNTVQVHIQNAIGKLGCSGRTEALSVARRGGLLP